MFGLIRPLYPLFVIREKKTSKYSFWTLHEINVYVTLAISAECRQAKNGISHYEQIVFFLLYQWNHLMKMAKCLLTCTGEDFPHQRWMSKLLFSNFDWNSLRHTAKALTFSESFSIWMKGLLMLMRCAALWMEKNLKKRIKKIDIYIYTLGILLPYGLHFS